MNIKCDEPCRSNANNTVPVGGMFKICILHRKSSFRWFFSWCWVLQERHWCGQFHWIMRIKAYAEWLNSRNTVCLLPTVIFFFLLKKSYESLHPLHDCPTTSRRRAANAVPFHTPGGLYDSRAQMMLRHWCHFKKVEVFPSATPLLWS